jgi:hypothetical protein
MPVDIVEKSDSLVALMGTFEARNGPFALYGDLVWSKDRTNGEGRLGAVSGLKSIAARVILGSTSFSNCSHLPASEGS